MKKVPTAYLSLGSNLGNRYQNLLDALAAVSNQVGTVKLISQTYENPPVGFESEENFLNLCAEIHTELTPVALLKELNLIEKELGRTEKSSEGYSSRLIDIDIILYDDVILTDSKLTIPHPHFKERLFVLKPLNDIAPSKIDPKTKQTIEQLYEKCTDQSILTVYNPATF